MMAEIVTCLMATNVADLNWEEYFGRQPKSFWDIIFTIYSSNFLSKTKSIISALRYDIFLWSEWKHQTLVMMTLDTGQSFIQFYSQYRPFWKQLKNKRCNSLCQQLKAYLSSWRSLKSLSLYSVYLHLFAGGTNMRGDQKWPPAEVKNQSELDNEERRKLAHQPAFRPRKVQKVSTHSRTVNCYVGIDCLTSKCRTNTPS